MARTAAEDRHARIVREKLQAYADRGVFRGYVERPKPDGSIDFRFQWLMSKPLVLIFEPQQHRLVFKNLLPSVPARSDMYARLTTYLAERSDTSLPPHRRVDPRNAGASFENRRGAVSLVLTVKGNRYGYGIGKILNLTNELFGYLQMNYLPYLWEEFDVSQE